MHTNTTFTAQLSEEAIVFRTIASIFLITLSASAQVELQQPYLDTAPQYYFEILNFRSQQKQSRLDFYFQIPYSCLHFIKDGNEFASTFTISIRLLDKDNVTAFEDSWPETAVCRTFDETVSENILSSSQRHFTVNHGSYTLYVTVTEPGTEVSLEEKQRVVVTDYSSATPSISDIMILTSSSASGGKHVIVPNVQRNVVSSLDSFPVFYEVYLPDMDSAYVTTEIAGAKDRVVYSNSAWIQAHDSVTKVFDEIPKVSLNMGLYRLKVSLRLSDGSNAPLLAEASSPFSIHFPELPSTITDLDIAAEQMMFIANSPTIDSIKSAPDVGTKVTRFVSFWKVYHSNFSADARTSMEEYYNRVAYANKQFTHFFEGWKSDRGMIYILFGPPDNVERYPFNIDSKPYEIWHYYRKARHFLFVDDTGFGDYRLRNQSSGMNSPFSGMDFPRK